ncbi:50S ribosomal protein 5, chloroplastic-like [Dorcoceras hygrometricum]|uniref:50S ribosomal protein 5, chloroplastic-like n=1 Tax=Dorcoceras hygrometricum TaxID=472368 RepID=A0A2Z7CNW0_9LAMI|nr:50S ribosomal protein 5, chloroplastic-like [Dorcoceras hygrometricum]
MALLFTTPLFYPTSSSSTSASLAHPLFSLGNIIILKHPEPSVGYTIHAPLVSKSRGALIAKASSGGDGTEASVPDAPTPSATDETVPVQNLPLESKVQMHLEQRMKMKIAKKIRLRRKRLLRKRILRKKGRWPPSKLKKNKNV